MSDDLSVPHCKLEGALVKPTLADRKKIRDDFEAKKPELEKEFSKLLGTEWTIHVDAPGVFTYMGASDGGGKGNPGSHIYYYLEGAVSNLKRFAEAHGADGIAQINSIASKHIVTLEPTTDNNVRYNTVDFHEGRWRLLFRDNAFGYNSGSVAENLGEVLNEAAKSTDGASLSLIAKKSIRDGYEKEVQEYLKQAQKCLKEPGLTFVPNFEANYAALDAFEKTLDREEYDDNNKLRSDWESTLGGATLSYFSGFVSQLKWKGFNKDDMMQEAFAESITSKAVKFEVAKEISQTYCDCVIEDGTLVLRTVPTGWYTNVDNAAEKLDELL